jgi:hypothetical protein
MLSGMDPARLANELRARGKISLQLEGEEISLTADDLVILKETKVEGISASVEELPEFSLTLAIFEPRKS